MDQYITDAIAAGEIVKVKPWGKDQGDFVLVNASDLDPAFHEPLDEPTPRKTRAKSVAE